MSIGISALLLVLAALAVVMCSTTGGSAAPTEDAGSNGTDSNSVIEFGNENATVSFRSLFVLLHGFT